LAFAVFDFPPLIKNLGQFQTISIIFEIFFQKSEEKKMAILFCPFGDIRPPRNQKRRMPTIFFLPKSFCWTLLIMKSVVRSRVKPQLFKLGV